jgi:hypothetical protein
MSLSKYISFNLLEKGISEEELERAKNKIYIELL